MVVGLHRGAIPMSDDKDKALTNVATLSSHIYDAYMGNPGKAPGMPLRLYVAMNVPARLFTSTAYIHTSAIH